MQSPKQLQEITMYFVLANPTTVTLTAWHFAFQDNLLCVLPCNHDNTNCISICQKNSFNLPSRHNVILLSVKRKVSGQIT